LEEKYHYYVQLLKEREWLNPETGGPLLGKIEPLLQPYMHHEGPVPEENLQKALDVSILAGATCETLGRIRAALDWYSIGQYCYRGGRVYSRHLGEEWPDVSAREDAGRQQLESAICATRADNHERARQLYEWAARNYGFSEREIPIWEGKEKTHIVLWTNLSYRAYALLCLGRWAEALSTAERGEAYFRRDRHWKDKTYSPIVLYPIVQAVARYKLDPSPENRRKAIEMLSPQAVASRNHVGHLWALFYLYNLRALHPELIEPPPARTGWAKPLVGEALQLAHPAGVSALALSSAGGLLAVGLTDGQIWLWRVGDWQAQARFRAHPNAIRALAFSPDGQLLASGANRAYQTTEPTLRLWRVEGQRLLHDLPGHSDGVTGLAFTADGRLLISASDDGAARVWRVEAGVEQGRLPAGGMLSALVISGQGERIALGRGDFHGQVLLWELRKGQTTVLEEHTESTCLEDEEPWADHSITGLSLASDETMLAAGQLNGKVAVFPLGRRKKPRVLAGHEPGMVFVAFTPEGETLISAGWDKSLLAWSVREGELLWESPTREEVTALAVSPDGERLVVGFKDGVVEVHARPGEAAE
jgi:hypothetical protein